LSLTLERVVNVAIPYANGGTNALSLYSEAITVAMAKAEDECPEAKDRLEVEKLDPSHVLYGSPLLGLCLCPVNFKACTKRPETTKLFRLNRAVLWAFSS